MRLLPHLLLIAGLGLPALAFATPDGEWREQRPVQRTAHAAFLDATHDRMILVGGVIENYGGDAAYNGATNDVWTLDLASPSTWTKLAPSGAPPTAVEAPLVIFDAPRERLVWVGGRGASMGDVWVLSLTGTPAWSQQAAAGPIPPARSHASAAYDPVRDQLVAFGGLDAGGNALGDVWTLSLATFTWSSVAPAGSPPDPRSRAAFVYDPPRDRFVLIGGQCDIAPDYRADVWSLELSGTPSWSALSPSGGPPSARAGASAVYDPLDGRLVVFGGGQFYVWFNDAWSLDLAAPAWSALAAGGGPPSVRDDHSAIFDPLRRRMTIYGGTTFYGRDEGWALDLSGPAAWSLLPMPFARPDARRGATVILDAPNQRLVCFGGGAPNNETWVMPLADPLQWTLLATGGTPPPARRYHSAILDPVRRRMIVFGGSGAAAQLHDVWALPLDGPPNWVELTPGGSQPGNRSDHAAIYDPVGDRMVIYGGYVGTSDYSDTWALGLSGSPSWTKLFPSGGSPGGRSAMSAAWDPVYARMILYGGFSQSGLEYLGDTWALVLSPSPAWRLVAAAGAGPSARSATAGAIDTRRGRLIVFGGNGAFGGSTRTNQVWSFGFADSAWAPLSPQGFLPSIRSAAVAAYDSLGDRLFAYGGFTGVDYSEVNWTLRFADEVVAVPRPGASAGAAFALYGAMPNPVRGDFTVAFRLPDAAPACLDVFDVAGRRVAGIDVGARGAGTHTVTLGDRTTFRAGVYLVRLSRAGERRVSRAVVLD